MAKRTTHKNKEVTADGEVACDIGPRFHHNLTLLGESQHEDNYGRC